ncbi:hypothetical protein ABZV91_15245 [Nocardia sp. NPDC004568]|uniref:hypothetical protein n=1 Tax=Nocardia sp. NPDC004568 TaxID=3154551 RepID=UPI0033A96393
MGAVATAQVSSGVSQIDGLGWMNITDSNGVPLSSYTFASNRGSLINPGYTILWTILGLEFVGYMAIVTTAIWIIGFTFGFTWLDMFANALNGVAAALSHQIATPMMLITAATIGAFFVAWFIVRGFPGKATMQVITMLGVAIIGPFFLAEPLADVLSSDGLLTQGRDVGLSVAAGLTGDSNPNPVLLVKTMQEDLADNFARKPVQVWNFGEVVDNSAACESAWSAGVLSGKDDKVLEGIEQCNSSAYSRANNPSMGQVGTGIILLICASLLLAFGVYLGFKVMKAAMKAVYHAFRLIFGCAAGGFMYGPTQTAMVHDIVDGLMAAARMTVFTIFLGVYILFMSNLFDQARGQVMSVMFIACTVMVVAISQLGTLSNSMSHGTDWVTNRVSLAIQGSPSGPGSSGPVAIGMGSMGGGGGGGGGGGSLSGLAAIAALNTINNSPVTGWLMAATPGPLNPLARGKKMSDLANIQTADSRIELYRWGQLGRANWLRKAQARAVGYGGMANPLGAANALDGLGDSRVPDSYLAAVLRAGNAPDELVHQVLRAQAAMKASMSTNPYGWAPLQKALAASRAVENHLRPTDTDSTKRAFAAQAVVAADNFARHTSSPPPGAVINHGFVSRVRQNWDSDLALRSAISPDEWNAVGRNTRWAIASEVSESFRSAANQYYNTPTESARRELARWSTRVANLDHLDPGSGLDPWDT